LLYLFFVIILILTSLITFLEFLNESLKTLSYSTNIINITGNSDEIPIKKNKHIRDLFDYIENRKTFINENFPEINYKNKLKINKFLQFNYSLSKNIKFSELINHMNEKKKKEILLFFNIMI